MPLRNRSGIPSTSPPPSAKLEPLPFRLPNDLRFAFQTGHKNSNDFDIDGPEAWGLQTDCRQVRVAVMDTGIDHTHPDLSANLWTNPHEIEGDGIDNDGNGYVDDVRGWNFVSNNSNSRDDHMHGTHVAGIVGAAGNNSEGVAGVCWTASLVSLKTFDASGDGFTSDIIEGVDYAAQMNFKLINASFGTATYSKTMETILKQVSDEGLLVVASAGNESSSNEATPSYPASYNVPNVISVASLSTSNGKLSSFSNYGGNVHIAAPGSSIYSTMPMSATVEMQRLGRSPEYAYLSGTSMAAPFVTGTAALLWSYDTGLTNHGLRARILEKSDTREDLGQPIQGNRVLNARKALEE